MNLNVLRKDINRKSSVIVPQEDLNDKTFVKVTLGEWTYSFQWDYPSLIRLLSIWPPNDELSVVEFSFNILLQPVLHPHPTRLEHPPQEPGHCLSSSMVNILFGMNFMEKSWSSPKTHEGSLPATMKLSFWILLIFISKTELIAYKEFAASGPE